MEYYFQDYVFKSQQLILLKQGKLVKLRVNEAKLLALLLSDPSSVFSKDVILSKVWSGKIVTEQAIFQNISRLRNIFDSDSIINHPKKGYQWNITLTFPQDEAKPAIRTLPATQSTSNTNTIKKYGILIFSVLLIIAYYFFYSTNNQANLVGIQTTPFRLALLPINQTTTNNKQASIDTSAVYEILAKELMNNKDIMIKRVDEKLGYRQLQANLEFVLWDKLTEHQTDALLLTDLSSKDDKYALSFSVETKGFSWQGKLLGHNYNHVLKQLKQQLAYVGSMQLVQLESITSKSINAKLILLHQQHPEDVIILENLIQGYLNTGHSDEALLLIVRLRELAEQQDNLTYVGRALLLEASVYLQKSYQDKARGSLELANKVFYQNSSPENQIAWLNVAINLAFFEHNYQKLVALSLKILQLSKNIGDYRTLFSSTLYMSILAQKFENLEDKDKYFQQAKAIYKTEYFVPQARIHLDFYHFVIAREEKNEAQQIKALQKILAISNQNKGINRFYKNEAQGTLANLFISKEQFDDALTIFNFEKELTAKEKYLLAIIYHRWGKDERAIDYAKQAHSDAIWSDELSTSLDSALLLLELSASKLSDNTIHQDVYVKYIRENHLPFWLTINDKRLVETQLPELLDLVGVAELDK